MKISTAGKIFFLFLLIFAGAFNSFSQERFVKPVNEAAKDASFLAFRAKLIDAAKRRDAKYFLGVLDRNIKTDFGGGGGVSDFKKMWKLENPKSEFWDEFLTVLTNGGAFWKREGAPKNQIFQAPYTFTEFPDDLDAFEHKTIFGSNVNLRAKPEAGAPVLAALSYNVVKVDLENSVKDQANDEKYTWFKVTTLGGKTGFVQAKYVRSPIDYRAIFEKRGGKWKLVTFIAGD